MWTWLSPGWTATHRTLLPSSPNSDRRVRCMSSAVIAVGEGDGYFEDPGEPVHVAA
jgi:hypothetical protein